MPKLFNPVAMAAFSGFAIIVLAACAAIYLTTSEPGVDSPFARGWVQDCAKHRPLADCEQDARKLFREVRP